MTAEIKRYMSIVNKKKVFLAKSKLNTIEVLISKAFIDSYNDHDESIWVSNVLREYNKMKNKIKNLENTTEYTIWKQWKRIVL